MFSVVTSSANDTRRGEAGRQEPLHPGSTPLVLVLGEHPMTVSKVGGELVGR